MTSNWRSTLAGPNDTVLDVMKIIEKDTLRAACVVDDEMNLLGLVTDGDIRRALIKGLSLSTNVQEIMTRNPKSFAPGYDSDELHNFLNHNRLIHMPIVKDGKLVELVTIEDLTQKNNYDNPVFIMAGGFGTRLRPLTDTCPKPLLKVGKKPMLETIIDQFIGLGFQNFYISTHYLPEMIRDYFGDGSKKGVQIRYVHESSPLGTGGALGLLPKDQIDLPLIMINGDILTNINFEKLLAYHKQNNVDATMVVKEYQIEVPYGVVETDGIHVDKMIEKPTHQFFINAGIYVVEPQIVHSMSGEQYIDMPSLLEEKMASGQKVGAFPIHEYWLDIGRMEDFKKANVDIDLLGLD